MSNKISIKDYLAQFSGENVIYKPNPGNGGDSVIASATYQLFDDCNIDYRFYREGINTKNSILMYGGGGNLVELYTNARDFIRDNHSSARRLVLLPHTINNNETLLKSLGNNVTIICREPVSFELVNKLATKCEVLLADDLALSLDIKRLLKPDHATPITIKDAIFAPRLVINDTLLKFRLSALNNHESIDCFRIDPESQTSDYPENNIDLSEVLTYKSYPRYVCDWISRSFARTLSRFENINTDRLHVSIVGGLLGKSTRLYAGNYYKNKAVYEFSIMNKLSTVQFIHDA